jgi:predicted ATPase/class 3 adenylate cyclase
MDTPRLPTGTVTFLFTDIEGSTQLWEQHPDAMRLALVRHDACLHAAITSNQGTVFKTVGDAFCACFATAADALDAALAAQRNLRSLQPSAVATAAALSLKVRMALHTGAAEARGGDYFGPALNRIARLLAIGHGGQVLLSQTTADLMQEEKHSAVSLRPLGSHRLRDLQRPEQVYQLMHPELPADFPPLKSLDSLPNNLPRQLTRFIGREHEIAEVKRLLSTTALLTLTGAGGCGKSRLALQVAAYLLEEYADGVWLVELAALSDPALAPQTVATALGVREAPGRPLTQTLIDFLRPKRVLLLLDNCEHLLAACTQLTETLLRACPHLRILASSREALGLMGEQNYRVPSLSLPDPKQLPPLERLQEYEALQLFTDRAVLSQATFAVTAANVAAVAQVCQRLDGIPLAIELAAARVSALPVEQIAARLDDRFRLLTGGSRTALPRQQTLRALIDWSCDLLSDPERAILRRLSVFAGGWTLEAAEAVCTGAGIESWEVLDLLTRLVDKSLVLYGEQSGASRYRLLETVRQYSRDRLLESGEAESIRWQHAHFFLAMAEREERPERSGRERLEREHDNLRVALEWYQLQEDGTYVQRLARSMSGLWLGRGHLTEGREHLARILSRRDMGEPTAARANVLRLAGMLAGGSGDYGPEQQLHQECLRIRRQLGNKGEIADSLLNLAYSARNVGDYVWARTLAEESLAVAEEAGDKRLLAYLLAFGGSIIGEQGDHAVARAYLERSLVISRELGERAHAKAHHSLARADRALGDLMSARAHLQETLALYRVHGWYRWVPQTLISLAGLEGAEGQFERAARLFGAADALRETLEVHLSVSERGEYERDQSIVHSALGEGPFAAAWAEGQTMTLEGALEYALGAAVVAPGDIT